jgi:hypothetical protein
VFSSFSNIFIERFPLFAGLPYSYFREFSEPLEKIIHCSWCIISEVRDRKTSSRRVLVHWGWNWFGLRDVSRCAEVTWFWPSLHCEYSFASTWTPFPFLSRRTLFVWHVFLSKSRFFPVGRENSSFRSISQNAEPSSIWKQETGWKMNLLYRYVNLTKIIQLRLEL